MIKKLSIFGIISISILLASHTSNANSSSLSAKDKLTTTSSSVRSNSGNETRFGLGFSSANFGLGYGGFTGNTSAFSSWLDINARHSLQLLVGVINTTGIFEFGSGFAYRFTLSGNQNAGFHVGPGFNLGTYNNGSSKTKFYAEILPQMGVHFSIPGAEQVGVSFDGGPVFDIIDGKFNFHLGAHSMLLGMSVHYFF